MPRFGLLGPLLIEDDDAVVVLAAPKLRVPMAALLLHANDVVSMECLIEALWDVDPPASARVTAQGHIKRLRHALGPKLSPRLRTTPSGYRLTVHDGELDSQSFTALYRRGRMLLQARNWSAAAHTLAESLALWRGDPLLDVASTALHRDAAPALSELRLHAVELRIAAELHLGRHSELVPQLRQLIAAHPLREGLYASRMLALHRSSRT